MDFKGTILLDASPALLAAVNRIADVLSANSPARNFSKPIFTQDGTLTGHAVHRSETPAEPAPAQKTINPESGQDCSKHVKASPAEEASAKTEESPNYTLVQVRKVMAEVQEKMSNDDEKRAVTKKMRDILLSLGAESIGKLPEEKYGEFIQQISAL